MPDLDLRDERCGNYRLLALIGHGGMGAVYRAEHPEIGRTVAIKVLRPELSSSEEAVARFFDEARAVNAIRHEGIVDIFDLGRRADGSTYYVMEHLTGEDLAQLIKREGPLPANEAVPLLRQVCAALGAAHRRGIVHRDLKPQNLFVVTRGAERRLKLLDFGIAKLMGELSDRPTTNTGVVLGTIAYMSPEQARGESVDVRADLYSLGCILFELLTGQVPFAAKNPLAILARLAVEEPTPPSARAFRFGVPPALDAVVLRALAKDRDRRYTDVEELDAALAAIDLSSLPAPAPQPAAPPPVDESAATVAEGEAPTIARSPVALHAAPPPASLVTPPDPRTATPPPAPRPDPLAGAERESLPESTRQLHEAPLPLIDPTTERRVIRLVIPVLLGLVVLGVGLYYAPGPSALDRRVLGRWMPIFAAAILGLCGLLVAVARTQQSSRARKVANRSLTVLSVAVITTSIYLKGAVTSYDILYYPVLIILDRLRENRSLAVFTFASSVLAFGAAVLLCTFGVVAYGPLYPGRVSPELVSDRGLAILVLLVMSGICFLSLLLVDVLVTRVQRREAELREVGLGLAGRVEEQVELLKRSAGLRRYLPPALADAILRGEGEGRSHTRRRVTIVRVDCPAIAGAVDETDPEEFAHLINQLYARLGDLASEHGGLVDRFGHGGATILFGALDDAEPEVQAASAVAFARASAAAIVGLSLACKAAGVVEAPVGRGAVHQGFATVGSFGSPTRLEFTAVGPVAEATNMLLDRAAPGQIILTQSVELSLGGSAVLTSLGEPATLPGARHPLRLYTL